MICRKQAVRTLMKTAVLLILLLILPVASALAQDIPAWEQRDTGALPEDFSGYWNLRWVRSDEAVDLRIYGFMEIYTSGTVTVCLGNEEEEVYYTGRLEDLGSGCMSVISEEAAEPLYLFLFEDNILGFAHEAENPDPVYYMEYDGMMEEEESESERVAGMIWDHAGELVYDAAMEDYEGTWCAFSCINDSSDEYLLYMAGVEMTLSISDGQAAVTYRIGETETVYTCPLTPESDCARILNEEGDVCYLVLTADGGMVLVENMEYPESAIFLLSEQQWEEEMSGVRFDPDPRPAEQTAIGSVCDLAGDWTATHINYGGLLYPAVISGVDVHLIISPEGEIQLSEGNEYRIVEGYVENGILTIPDEETYDRYYLLYDGDLLVETEDINDMSLVVYYQQLDTPSQD